MKSGKYATYFDVETLLFLKSFDDFSGLDSFFLHA